MFSILGLPAFQRAKQPTVDSTSAAVRCTGLTKEFGRGETRTVVLREINCDVSPGRMSLLVGPSGCGKTTLISIIAGLLNPTAGSVQVFGTDLAQLSSRALVEFRARQIGFVFQQYNLIASLTAAENVAVPLLINHVSWKSAVATGRAWLERVGLGNRADQYPNQLSGGQQQRVAIARALAVEPRLLVCDEPTAALDAASGRLVMELLRDVALRPDRAVIVVTHDQRVLDLGDETIEMADGEIVSRQEFSRL